ncbi:MAG: chaperonin GroEL [Caldilineaceae bacterium]
MNHPRLLFAPAARQAFSQGFNALSNLMEVALGPKGRTVAIAPENPRKAPELLSDGANIARRFLGFPNRFETMGAFLARHIAWQMEEAIGDGATTAVVLARQVLNETNRQVAAGHNVMLIRRGLEKVLPHLLAHLHDQATPLENAHQIQALATALVGDQILGCHLEEIFDTVGVHGAIQVRSSYARKHDRRYIQGTFWNQGWVSSYFTTEGSNAIVKAPYLLFTTRELTQADELLGILNQVREAGDRGLVVLAPAIGGDALNILVTNKVRNVLPTLAIKAPGLGPEKFEILEDLATLCGGQLLRDEVGLRVEQATLADLGQADEVQAIRSGFTLIGGKGRPAAIRRRRQELQQALQTAQPGRQRDRLVERTGKLLGGVALLEVGGATEIERDYLKARAQDAVQGLRLALQDGVVTGGGVAYLRCLPCLDDLAIRNMLTPEEAIALPIIRQALLAPARAILRNAGLEPAPVIQRILDEPGSAGYDLLQTDLFTPGEAPIVDPVQIAHKALEIGISGALMALTTEVLVHRPRHNRDEEVDFRV